jgi:predicted AAA+ superfamily ATPase
LYLEEFIIYWWYPEVVKAWDIEEKKQIFADIFSFWFNKDILPEIKKDYKFNDFLKQVAFYTWELLNLNEIAKNIWVSQPTVQNYINLLEQSLILYPIRPFFSNKLKEVIKMPKYYFADIGFRNFLINRFDFRNNEFWILFENFIFSELLKKWFYYWDIKFYRTKNWSTEVDFILDLERKALEIKYKEKLKDSDLKWLKKFKEIYPDFETQVINKTNFYKEIIKN